MRVLLLTAVALAAVALCSAAKKDPECAYRKQRKLQMHWANPNACDRFYRCSKDLKTEVVCEKGKVYNSKTGKCAKATKGLCTLSLAAPMVSEDNACAKQVNGAYVARSGSCRDFFICEDRAAFPQSCPAGTYFNATSEECLTDTNRQCRQNDVCNGVIDGQSVANDESCRSFYVCQNGDAVLQQCSPGSYFTADQNCQPDEGNTHCWENFCIDKSDSTWLPNKDNCTAYYVCSSNSATPQTCPAGSYFDWTDLNCQPGTCPSDETSTECTETPVTDDPCTEAPITEAPCGEEVALEAAKAAQKITCPDNAVEGGFLPHPSNCMHFYICSNGYLEEYDCLPGNYYDTKEMICKADVKAKCAASQAALGKSEAQKDKKKKKQNEDTEKTKKGKKEKRPKRSVGAVPQKRFFLTKELMPDDHDMFNDEARSPMAESYYAQVPKAVEYYYPNNQYQPPMLPAVPNNQVFFKKELPKVEEATESADEPETTTESSVEQLLEISSAEKEEMIANLLDQHRLYLKKENLKKRPLNYAVNLGHLEEDILNEETNTEMTVEPTEDDLLELTEEEKEKMLESLLGKYGKNTLLSLGEGPHGQPSGAAVTDELMAAFLENLNNHLSHHNTQDSYSRSPSGAIGIKYMEKQSSQDVNAFRAEFDSKELLCKGRYYLGEMVPITTDCRKYEVCDDDGELKVSDCGSGNYFNYSAQTCLRDEHDICPEPVCQGRYYFGDMVPMITNCRKFKVCEFDGEMKTSDCGIGNYFDQSVGVCRQDTKNVCPDAFLLDTFDEEDSDDLPVSVDDCNTDDASADLSNCTCPGGYTQGQRVPHFNECRLYYTCENRKLVPGDCGEGFIFIEPDCKADVNNECGGGSSGSGENPGNHSEVCIGIKEGGLVPNPSRCYGFYRCVQGEPVEEDCGYGEYFSDRSCIPDLTFKCRNPCENTVGIVLMPHPSNASEYIICNNGSSSIAQCEPGLQFDPSLEHCSDNGTTILNMCLDQVNGTTFPIKGVNDSFYLCLGGQAYEKSCLNGYIYYEEVGLCREPPSVNCNQSACALGDNLQPFLPIDGEENQFCICIGTEAFLKTCPEGYIFLDEMGVCFSNASCNSEMCVNGLDFSTFPNQHDDSSFCLCVSGTAVIVECPNSGLYNPYQQKCVQPVPQSENCTLSYCAGKPDYTIFASNAGNEGFCMCENSNGTYHLCPQDYVFSSSASVCVHPLNDADACDGSVCTQEFEVFPVLQDDSLFCLCTSDSTAVVRECPPRHKFNGTLLLCELDLCDSLLCSDPAYQYVPQPAYDYDYGFCICEGVNAVFYSCPEGTMFDQNIGICMSESVVECDISMCNTDREYPYAVPTTNNPNAFCYCHSSTSVSLHKCPYGAKFDASTELCEDLSVTDAPSECSGQCENTTCIGPSGSVPNGGTIPHPMNCTQYLLCNCETLTTKQCLPEQFYNVSMGRCVDDVNRQCLCENTQSLIQSSKRCLGMYKLNDRIAHPTNRSAFYLCYNGSLHQEFCDAGYYFEPSRSLCLHDSVKNAVKQLSHESLTAAKKLKSPSGGRHKRAVETDEAEPAEDT